jgi:hypothetical protein
MPLPKIDHPTFEVQLNSVDKKLKFRPFLVKEEKLLLIAKESDDLNDVFKTMKQIVQNCCLDEIDVESLPVFDIEMIFIHLRINSVGESVEMTFTCDNVVEGNTCSHVTEFDLNLKNIKYSVPEGHNRNIKLSDKIGVVFNYPTLQLPKELLDETDDGGFNLITNYVDYIYDDEQIYKSDETPKEELKEFFESLTLDQIRKVKTFFLTTPTVVLDQDIKCAKCGHNHHMNVEGVLNFFE